MKNIIFYASLCIGLLYSPNTICQVFDKNELEIKINALIPTEVNDSTPGLVGRTKLISTSQNTFSIDG